MQTFSTFTPKPMVVNDSESFGNETEKPDSLYRHPPLLTIFYCIAYFIVFIVGILGNSFVVAVVHRNPRMKTVTNYFIVNLAIADLIIIFCLPATLIGNIFTRKYTVLLFSIQSLSINVKDEINGM